MHSPFTHQLVHSWQSSRHKLHGTDWRKVGQDTWDEISEKRMNGRPRPIRRIRLWDEYA